MREKFKYILLTAILVLEGAITPNYAVAERCPDLRVVFARGSGGERWNDPNYLTFKETIESKLSEVDLDYEFIDLDYPAVGVGIDNLDVTLGAFFGGGESYEFGESVKEGINNLTKMVNNTCPNTKYVIGGYSQGAMVISGALKTLNADRIIFVATFGDPKIYLPEGEGLIPDACSGKNLSDYRTYVPDCHAYKGLLGANMPYQPSSLIGKVGTWCNKMDIFCSSWLSIDDHIAYISDDLYGDASKVIFDKITKSFGLVNHLTSTHDTVIMLDSSSSMNRLIDKYKAEALRLAKLTFDSGGRVALYDYRDLDDPYTPVEHCNFETCTIEVIQDKLDNIRTDGGGDTNESLLSAAFYAMKSLEWQFGATKSVVVITDAPFLSPDRDGITIDEVVRLSKEIDPVNFYVITYEGLTKYFAELTEGTDGMVVSDLEHLDFLTDYIMERYDSLPRVVEEEFSEERPEINVTNVTYPSETEVKIEFEKSSNRAIVILNDMILGVTELNEITIDGLQRDIDNQITLIPITDSLKGNAVNILIEKITTSSDTTGDSNSSGNSGQNNASTPGDVYNFVQGIVPFLTPKAPNTGKR